MLSRRGWFVLLGCLVLSALGFLVGIHSFLAVTKPVTTDYLVIEGWIPNYALEESIKEFQSRPYRHIFVVGCNILSGVNVEPGENSADYAAQRLKWLGIDSRLIQSVPAHVDYRNRTYQSALELSRFIKQNHLPVRSFNVVTIGCHSRRSRLLFQKAFEGQAEVGIIAITDREYDPKHWWKYSEGVREVLGEGIAYLYARFLFHSPTNEGIHFQPKTVHP